MTPQIDRLRKIKLCSEGFNIYVYGVSKEIDRKICIFRVNIGMWPLKLIILAKQAMCWGFQHTFMGFLRRYMGNIHFSSKPRHVTPQIDHLRKTSPVLRVSTHTYGVSKEIHGKTFIFQSKPRHVTPQIDFLRTTNPVLRISTHIYGISQEIDRKSFILQ